MHITRAEFIISNTNVDKCPAPNLPEYAFIGRSNVGKSSLLNMLTNQKSLAKISGKPGKTRLINHFLINEEWYLVDLPGYGYAKVSKSLQSDFQKIIYSYIKNRKNLVNLFVLVDSRHELQKNDRLFMEYLGKNKIPFAIIFTKADKLSLERLKFNMEKYKTQMLEKWEEMPPFFISSATTCLGKEEILNYIEHINKSVKLSLK